MSFPGNDPRRWLLELDEVERRWPTACLEWRDGRPTLLGRVTEAAVDHHFRLVWPVDYPYRPPSIWETRGPDGDAIDRTPTGHVFADGSLCLFPHAAEGWHSDRTAADALDRFRTFVVRLAAGDLPPLVGRPVALNTIRFSVPPRLGEILRKGGRFGIAKALVRHDLRLIRLLGVDGTTPSAIVAGLEEDHPTPDWANALGLNSVVQAKWCRVRGDLSDLRGGTGHDSLKSRIREQLGASADFVLDAPLLIVLDEAEQLSLVLMQTDAAQQAALAGLGDPLVLWPAVVEDIRERLFLRVDGRLSGRDQLAKTTAVVVGCGSLGSRVALDLARAGIGRFVLFDPEVLEPENVPRHVGTLRQIGCTKVDVVRTAILSVNPDAEVDARPVAVSLDPVTFRSDRGSLAPILSHPSVAVVICTTAAEAAERLVNGAAVAADCPALFATVLGRGEHGRVFRVLPRRTPCYACVVHAQSVDPERFPQFHAADGAEEPPAYQQPGIPGLGMDVDQVALIAARMALQTIGYRSGIELGYPSSRGDHVLWSNHGGWVLDGPLQARVERIQRWAECPVCGDPARAPLDESDTDRLRALEQKLLRN